MSAVQIPMGQKSVKSTEGPWQLCWPLDSLVMNAAGVLCRAGHWELWSFSLHS